MVAKKTANKSGINLSVVMNYIYFTLTHFALKIKIPSFFLEEPNITHQLLHTVSNLKIYTDFPFLKLCSQWFSMSTIIKKQKVSSFRYYEIMI